MNLDLVQSRVDTKFREMTPVGLKAGSYRPIDPCEEVDTCLRGI